MRTLFGPNWKTTISGIGNTIATVMLSISVIPYSIPTDLLPYLDPTIKARLFQIALGAKIVLGVWNAISQKDKHAIDPAVVIVEKPIEPKP
jgi:hypothetical protein